MLIAHISAHILIFKQRWSPMEFAIREAANSVRF